MSQHDMVLDNQTRTAFRQDLNNALQALVTQSSGASAPTTTYAFQIWVDTSVSPKVMYIRNSANTAWVRWGYIDATTNQLIPDDVTDAVNAVITKSTYVAAGTDTYTVTISEVSAYVTGDHYFIKFTNANTLTAPTLNINSLGAKTIKKEGGSALLVGDIPANHAAIIKYDGVDIILLNPKSSTGEIIALRDTFRDLIVINTAGFEASKMDVDAAEGVLQDVNGVPKRIANINLTIDIAVSGANGLFTGTEAADTWYYIWVTNGTSGTCGGFHTSSDLATVLAVAPAGYNTYGALAGAIRNNVSSDFERIRKEGRRTQYTTVGLTQRVAYSTVNVGSLDTPTWVSVPVRNATTLPIPPTAKKIIGYTYHYTTTGVTEIGACPNNAYGGRSSSTNPCPISDRANSNSGQTYFNFMLESDNIYWAFGRSDTGQGGIWIIGWED